MIAQENMAYSHLNSGFMWLRRGAVAAEAWQKVLEMDMAETSRDQFNYNTASRLVFFSLPTIFSLPRP